MYEGATSPHAPFGTANYSLLPEEISSAPAHVRLDSYSVTMLHFHKSVALKYVAGGRAAVQANGKAEMPTESR